MVILRQVGDTPYCLSLAPSFNRKDCSSFGYSSHTFQPSRLCSAIDRQIIVLPATEQAAERAMGLRDGNLVGSR